MKAIVEVTIVPIGAGTSVSEYVAACERIFAARGVKAVLHANGTNLEGEWDAVFGAIRECHETVHRMGAARIFSTIHANTRTDRDQTMEDKLASVTQKLSDAG
jgi:uncharacterized protein (TIGR00106 family)